MTSATITHVFADILNPCDKDMKIKSHPKLGVYIEGLSELAVRDANDLQRLYDQGNNPGME